MRLRGRRVPDLGRRLLRPARRGRLLRRLRDPPLGRRRRVRRGGGDRAAAPARPRDRRAEQRRDGRGRRRAAVARLERLQRRRPVRVEHVGRGRGAEHQPVHRGRVAGLGRVGLPDRPQAVDDRQRQRHDRRSRRDHAGRRLRQRLGRDRDGRHRLDARVLRAQLPEPPAAVPQRRRHARRDLHPRLRRARRRPAGRGLRRPEHGAVLQDQQARAGRGRRRGRPDPRQRHAAEVAVPRGAVRDLLDRGDHVHPAEARRAVHPAADVRGEHGDRRRRRARPRGLPVRRPVARVPERDPGHVRRCRTRPPFRPRQRPHDEQRAIGLGGATERLPAHASGDRVAGRRRRRWPRARGLRRLRRARGSGGDRAPVARRPGRLARRLDPRRAARRARAVRVGGRGRARRRPASRRRSRTPFRSGSGARSSGSWRRSTPTADVASGVGRRPRVARGGRRGGGRDEADGRRASRRGARLTARRCSER